MFSLICVWINSWVNNREAGDLRRYRGHYDVNVINISAPLRIYMYASPRQNWLVHDNDFLWVIPSTEKLTFCFPEGNCTCGTTAGKCECGEGCKCDKCPVKSSKFSRWRHQMETFSALLAICAGNSPVTGELTGEFPTQRPVTRSFDVFFDLLLNKRLSKQSWGWWFETPSRSLWRQCNVHWNTLIMVR